MFYVNLRWGNKMVKQSNKKQHSGLDNCSIQNTELLGRSLSKQKTEVFRSWCYRRKADVFGFGIELFKSGL